MAIMEAGKQYRIVVAFRYDVYEATVTCVDVLPKSYRVRKNGELRLIKMSDLVEAKETPTI